MSGGTEDLFDEYQKAFRSVGVKHVFHLDIKDRDVRKTLSIYDVKVHVLSQADRFDLLNRAPRQMKGRAVHSTARLLK